MTGGAAQALAALARGEEGKALRALFDAEAPALFGLAIVMLGDAPRAADALHDAVVSAARRAGSLPDAGWQAEAWLIHLLRDAALERLRAAGREGARDAAPPLPELSPLAATAPGRALAGRLAAMGEGPRHALLRAWLHGFSVAELAAELRRPPQEAEDMLDRAVAALAPDDADAAWGRGAALELGTLPAAAALAAEAQARVDPALAAARRMAAELLCPLALLAPPVQPPPGVWPRIAESLEPVLPIPTAGRPGRPHWATRALAWAATAAALVLAVILWRQEEPAGPRAVLAAPGAPPALLAEWRGGAWRIDGLAALPPATGQRWLLLREAEGAMPIARIAIPAGQPAPRLAAPAGQPVPGLWLSVEEERDGALLLLARGRLAAAPAP